MCVCVCVIYGGRAKIMSFVRGEINLIQKEQQQTAQTGWQIVGFKLLMGERVPPVSYRLCSAIKLIKDLVLQSI